MKYLRHAAALLLVAGMMGAASLLGEKEIIFPEILALAAGAWGAEKQPWKANRMQIFFFMTIASIFGVFVVRYLPVSLFFQVVAAFLFAAAALLLTGTGIVPMISACVLPILLQTESWVYPLAVVALTGTITLGQWLMERFGLREKENQSRSWRASREEMGPELLRWGKLLAFFLVMTALALSIDRSLLIAPPLLVTYAELSHAEGKPRKRPGMVFLLLAGAAWVGAFLRLVVCERLHCPLWLTAVLAAALLAAAFECGHMVFPPAGAVVLLPMLLDAGAVQRYPLLVTIGAALFLAAAVIQFPKGKNIAFRVESSLEKEIV